MLMKALSFELGGNLAAFSLLFWGEQRYISHMQNDRSETANHFLKRALFFLGGPRLLFYVLPYLMVILILGTVSQKWIGLYAALETYFYSFYFMIGILPLPGGLIAMGLVFVNMIVKFIWFSPWSRAKTATNLTHLGVIILLAGGIVSALTRYDGVMGVALDQTESAAQSYEDADFVVRDETRGDVVLRLPYETLRADDVIAGAQSGLPFDITILDACLNCDIVLRDPSQAEDWVGPAASMALVDKKPDKQPENNLQGVSFRIEGTDAADGNYLTFESFPKPPRVEEDEKAYTLYVERRPHELPFQVQLTAFEKTLYPGTDKAKAYRSDVIIRDGEQTFAATVTMNNPLRYEGYTLYQSSYYALPDGTPVSVFSVVRNKGYVFPYVSCILIALGLLLHVVFRTMNGVGARSAARPVTGPVTGMVNGTKMRGEDRANKETKEGVSS